MAATNSGLETVMHEAGHRKRHSGGISCLQDEARILQSKFGGKARGFVGFAGNQRAVRVMKRSGEKSSRQDFQEFLWRDSGFSGEREGFTEAFEHGCDKEIAGDLHGIRRGWFGADDECALAERIEQWLDALNFRRRSTCDNEQFFRGGSFGTAKDRSGHVGLSGCVMGSGKFFGERNADGAHADVKSMSWQRAEDSIFTEDDGVEGRIIRD